MKQQGSVIAPIKFTEKEKQLLAKYYPDAYRMAYSISAPQVSDDVRENIAFNALQRVIKGYDKNKRTKLTTFLYLCIYRSLKSEVWRVHRRPYPISEVQDPLTSEYVSIFNLLEERPSTLENYDWKEYDHFVTQLKSRVTDRQKQIVEMLINPEEYLTQYVQKVKVHRIPKRITYSVIAKQIGKSVAKVSFEMKEIRAKAKQILKELGRDYD